MTQWMNTKREFSAQIHITRIVEEFLFGISYLCRLVSLATTKHPKLSTCKEFILSHRLRVFRSVSTGHVSLGLRGGKNPWWERVVEENNSSDKGESDLTEKGQSLPSRVHKTHPLEVPSSSHWYLSNNQAFLLFTQAFLQHHPPHSPVISEKWNFQ